MLFRSLPSTAPSLALPGRQFIEWGGALRWLKSGAPADVVRGAVQELGGHATLFRASDRSAGAFHPLPPALMKIHQGVKCALDPAGVFNPGRMYAAI